jgi:chromosome segregation ATPase
MFSCATTREVQTSTPPKTSDYRPDSVQQPFKAHGNQSVSTAGTLNPSQLNDREMLDRVIEEGMKLKQKCKQLRYSLLEKETQLEEMKQLYTKQISDIKRSNDSEISELKAQHFLELAHTKDYRVMEIDDLRNEKHFQNERIATLTQNYNNLSTQFQSLQEENQNYKQEMNRIINDYGMKYQEGYQDALHLKSQEIGVVKESYEQKLKNLEMDYLEIQEKLIVSQEESNLLRTHIENDNQCSVCKEYEKEIELIKCEKEEVSFQLLKCRDEFAYYQEEFQRFEEEYDLMKREIDSHRNQAMESQQTPDYRGVLRSEREQRKRREINSD